MIHYHGTPLTPRSEFLKLAGKSFCVSFADPRSADDCLQIGQSVMWDNGAFSLHTKGKVPDWGAYYSWLEPRISPVHWAVVPDVIDGDIEQQRALVATWPFARELAAPVWHMGLDIAHLLDLAEQWPRVCFGSSARYWQVGSDLWCRRADQAWNALAKRGLEKRWFHMLRGLSLCGDRWPFASADSTNVALNYGGDSRRGATRGQTAVCPERMARRIDAIQNPVNWTMQPEQMELIA